MSSEYSIRCLARPHLPLRTGDNRAITVDKCSYLGRNGGDFSTLWPAFAWDKRWIESLVFAGFLLTTTMLPRLFCSPPVIPRHLGIRSSSKKETCGCASADYPRIYGQDVRSGCFSTYPQALLLRLNNIHSHVIKRFHLLPER